MKLRLILIILSLLSFLSASAGGYLYYASLKEAAFHEAERQSLNRLVAIKKNLIAGMKERAGLVGGKLEVQSQARKGTSVYFKVPIELTSSLASPIPGPGAKLDQAS